MWPAPFFAYLIHDQERSRKLFKSHISALFLFLCSILSSKFRKKNFNKFPTTNA